MKTAPRFPPLLKGYRVPQGKKPVVQALAMLDDGKLSAGDILWSEEQNHLRFNLVLEPEVERERCSEMLFMLMTAFGDALGAISAPEIAINYRWPSTILLNEAVIGSADLIVSEAEQNGFPTWLLLGLDIAIRPDLKELDPGLHKDRTTIWDEGCGDISRTQLLESASRHVVNWIHTWNEEGFKQIHEQWMGRISEKEKIETGLTDGEFISLDDHGNALIKEASELTVVETFTALEGQRS